MTMVDGIGLTTPDTTVHPIGLEDIHTDLQLLNQKIDKMSVDLRLVSFTSVLLGFIAIGLAYRK
jgi:hypothetical protein